MITVMMMMQVDPELNSIRCGRPLKTGKRTWMIFLLESTNDLGLTG